MPFRIDVRIATADSLDRIIELGALDADVSPDGTLAAIMPDSATPEQIARALGDGASLSISAATPRDEGSVWVLRPRPIRIGRLVIAPADASREPGVVRLIDTPAFGTGLHPTTALCLEVLQAIVDGTRPETVLDVGTGSGVLALAALELGVPRAVAIDIDDDALSAAAANAGVNGLTSRIELRPGGPEALTGTWPLILANVLAAPLIDMAPALVRRLAPRGQLVVSGIPASVAPEVDRTYRNLGLRPVDSRSRSGWVALVFRASW